MTFFENEDKEPLLKKSSSRYWLESIAGRLLLLWEELLRGLLLGLDKFLSAPTCAAWTQNVFF